MMINKVKAVIQAMGKTRYKVMKETGLSRNTIYNSYRDEKKWLAEVTVDAFLRTYPTLTLDDLMERVPD